MPKELCNDIINIILSFLIEVDTDVDKTPPVTLILTNDILLLKLTSKYCHYMINKYIDNYKNARVRCKSQIKYASVSGHVSVLDWFKVNGYKFHPNSDLIHWISSKGHVNVLEWYTKNKIYILYKTGSYYPCNENIRNITTAAYNGKINVLEWWLNYTK